MQNAHAIMGSKQYLNKKTPGIGEGLHEGHVVSFQYSLGSDRQMMSGLLAEVTLVCTHWLVGGKLQNSGGAENITFSSPENHDIFFRRKSEIVQA